MRCDDGHTIVDPLRAARPWCRRRSQALRIGAELADARPAASEIGRITVGACPMKLSLARPRRCRSSACRVDSDRGGVCDGQPFPYPSFLSHSWESLLIQFLASVSVAKLGTCISALSGKVATTIQVGPTFIGRTSNRTLAVDRAMLPICARIPEIASPSQGLPYLTLTGPAMLPITADVVGRPSLFLLIGRRPYSQRPGRAAAAISAPQSPRRSILRWCTPPIRP